MSVVTGNGWENVVSEVEQKYLNKIGEKAKVEYFMHLFWKHFCIYFGNVFTFLFETFLHLQIKTF